MFHPDGLLIRFLTKVCDLLLLNLALVLSCVTVVFSGTARPPKSLCKRQKRPV